MIEGSAPEKIEDVREYARIEREIYVDAAPEVVYEVISTPEHLRQWWPDEAELEPVPGAAVRHGAGMGMAVVGYFWCLPAGRAAGRGAFPSGQVHSSAPCICSQ